MKRLMALALISVMLAAFIVYIPFEARADAEAFGRSKLSGKELTAYDLLADGISKKLDRIDISACGIDQEQMNKIFRIFVSDHPECYYIATSFSMIMTNGQLTHVKPAYLSGYNDALFKSEADKLLALTKNANTDYDKALILHDALVESITYADTGENSHNAYGAIVDKKAVCEGYAEAYNYLLGRLGIQTYAVAGTAKSGNRISAHEWSLLRLDGNYYYTDVTWDDPGSAGGEGEDVWHAYFCLPSSLMDLDHFAEDAYSFLPKAVSSDKFCRDLTVLRSYTIEGVASAIKTDGNIGKADILFTGTNDDFINWFSVNYSAVIDKTAFAGKAYRVVYASCGREHTITVNVENTPATSVVLNKKSTSLTVGGTELLIATVKPMSTTDTVTWSSDAPAVASVDARGRVTALSEGTAKITAKAGSVSASCTVTVKKAEERPGMTLVPYKASTATSRGWEAYYVSTDGKYYNISGAQISGIPYLPLAEHTGGEATCSKRAVCTDCGEEYGDLDPNNHVSTELTGQKDPDCGREGYTGDTVCAVCGKLVASGEAIPATGEHNFEKGICTVCGRTEGAEEDPVSIPEGGTTSNTEASDGKVEGDKSEKGISMSTIVLIAAVVIVTGAITLGGAPIIASKKKKHPFDKDNPFK